MVPPLNVYRNLNAKPEISAPFLILRRRDWPQGSRVHNRVAKAASGKCD